LTRATIQILDKLQGHSVIRVVLSDSLLSG
jgi:hypothetical protein